MWKCERLPLCFCFSILRQTGLCFEESQERSTGFAHFPSHMRTGLIQYGSESVLTPLPRGKGWNTDTAQKHCWESAETFLYYYIILPFFWSGKSWMPRMCGTVSGSMSVTFHFSEGSVPLGDQTPTKLTHVAPWLRIHPWAQNHATDMMHLGILRMID